MKETELYRNILNAANALNYGCLAVQSRTVSGFPDVLLLMDGVEVWLELKCVNRNVERSTFKVGWRPGQQVWYMNYYNNMRQYVTEHIFRQQNVVTLIKGNDGFLIIENTRYFTNNIISTAAPEVTFIPEDLSYKSVLGFIRMASCTYSFSLSRHNTARLFSEKHEDKHHPMRLLCTDILQMYVDFRNQCNVDVDLPDYDSYKDELKLSDTLSFIDKIGNTHTVISNFTPVSMSVFNSFMKDMAYVTMTVHELSMLNAIVN